MKRYQKWLLFAVIFSLLISGSFACGKKENPFLGKWIAIQSTEGGNVVDLAKEPLLDYALEVFPQQKAKLYAWGEGMDVVWKQEGENIIIQGGGTDMLLEMQGGLIKASLNGNPYAVLAKEGTAEAKAVQEALAGFMASVNSEENVPETSTTAPDTSSTSELTPTGSTYSDEERSALEEQWLDEWYGIMTISGGKGAYADISSESFDVWASTFIDSGTERYAFEVYWDEAQEEIYLSMYVDLYPNYIQGVIGVEDAWIDERDLTPEESSLFAMVEMQGYLMMGYEYVAPDNPDDQYTVTIMLRRYGDRWEGETNLPPGFADYIAGLGEGNAPSPSSTSGAAAPTAAGELAKLLQEAKFSTATKEFTAEGITVTYPEANKAEASMMGGVAVDFDPVEEWPVSVTAKKNSYADIAEEKSTFELIYGEVEGFVMEDSTYQGFPAVIVAYGDDGLSTANLMIFVYPTATDRYTISCMLLKGTMQDILGNQDILATMNSVKW